MDLDTSGIWQTIEGLERAGYRAWLVGGAVRDLLQGERPRDMDLLTDAGGDAISRLFPRAKRIGKGDRVSWILPMGEGNWEITSLDGRSLEEELERRDFTINAMAMAPDGSVTDPFNGRRDLEEGILRFTGSPFSRLHEDPVRALRFCRFASLYDMLPDPGSCSSIMELSPGLPRAHMQRVGKELLLCARRGRLYSFLCLADHLRLTRRYGFFPGMEEHGFSLVLEGLPPVDALACLGQLEREGCHSRCTLGLFFLKGPESSRADPVGEFIRGYAWPRKLVKGILQVRRFALSLVFSFSDRILFEMIEEAGPQVRRESLALAHAILSRAGRELTSLLSWEEHLSGMERDLLSFEGRIDGEDIMELSHLPPGSEVGRIMRRIRFMAASGQISTREEAIREIGTISEN